MTTEYVNHEGYKRRESKLLGDTFAGLEYDTELAGPDGVWCLLFLPPGTTPEQVQEAKSAARHSRDVVSFRTQRIPAEWVEPEHKPQKDAAPWIDAIRHILEHGVSRIGEDNRIVPDDRRGGVMLDRFSASAMAQVYDALNDKNRRKFGELHLAVAHNVAFGLINKGATS